MIEKFRVTVGIYEDLVDLGTFDTRELALQAIGEYAIGRCCYNSVEYPAIELVDERGNYLRAYEDLGHVKN